MRDFGLTLIRCGIASTALAEVAWAQLTVADSTTSSSVSERLAQSIEANTPCDRARSLGVIEVEIESSGAGTNAIEAALKQVLTSDTACAVVKDASAQVLATLPETIEPIDAVEPASTIAAVLTANVPGEPVVEEGFGDIDFGSDVPGDAMSDTATLTPPSLEEDLDFSFTMGPPPGNPAFRGN